MRVFVRLVVLFYKDCKRDLQAAEASEAQRFTTAKLEIIVKPVDSHPPEIKATATEGYVDENAPIGTQVVDSSGNPVALAVTDADLVRQSD